MLVLLEAVQAYSIAVSSLQFVVLCIVAILSLLVTELILLLDSSSLHHHIDQSSLQPQSHASQSDQLASDPRL